MNETVKKNHPQKEIEAVESKASHRVGRRKRGEIKILFKINMIRSVDESRRDILQF
jgi:hypothetical protein